MPKRSNDFQKLVRLIQQAYAPRGATVTESAMLDHLGTPREIDVLITTDVGPYTMKIAVEVKDHSRPLGPGQIEEYIGKYRSGDGIPVNQVVVVSSTGFTRAAKDRARIGNIKLLTLKEARSADWRGFIPPDKPRSLTLQMPPHWHPPTFVPSLPDSLKVEDVMQTGRIICNGCGKSRGTPVSVVRRAAASEQRKLDFPHRIKETMAANGGHALVKFNIHQRNCHLEYQGACFPLEGIKAELHFHSSTNPLTVETFEQIDDNDRKQIIQRATATVAGKLVQLVIPNGLRSQAIVIDISDASNCSGATGKRKR